MAVEVVLAVDGVAVGLVEARGCQNGEAPQALADEVTAAVARCAAFVEDQTLIARKAAVREMLRVGRYRPTGRGKPASEYLRQAALEGRFPRINALVDIINLVSLETMLPISVVDIVRAGTERFVVRRGREGEAYIFNPSGQVIDLCDLLLTARLPDDRPCASPVKDSQQTKTDISTQAALAVVYGPSALADAVRDAALRMANLIERFCGAMTTTRVLVR